MRKMTLLLSAFVLMAPLFSQAQQPAMAPEPAMAIEYRVDSDASWLRVLAYPDGPLKRFGHHHVISHHGITGTVEVPPNPLESTITLELIVTDLQVDDAALRELEGENFEKEVSQKDKDGTKANMLGEKLLHGAEFPTIQIQSAAITGSMPSVNILTTVSVAGMEKTVSFPANIELADDSFVANGQLEITHGELGLSPFKAAGGALSVRDLLVIKYEISGERATMVE